MLRQNAVSNGTYRYFKKTIQADAPEIGIFTTRKVNPPSNKPEFYDEIFTPTTF